MSMSIDISTDKDIFKFKNDPLNKLDGNIINELLEELTKEKNDEHDRLVGEFFNHCVMRCKENKLETMYVVTALLPCLISDSYKNPIIYLRKQLTYVRFPLEHSKRQKYPSTYEPLWGYKFDYYRFSDLEKEQDPKYQPKQILSPFDRFEKIARHSATLCYVPLPGLCTYPKRSGIFEVLFPCSQSPFVRLTLHHPIEFLQDSTTSFELFSSPPFQAIVKFKWHAFARSRFIVTFSIYLINFGLFTLAIGTKDMRIMKTSMTFGSIFLTLNLIRLVLIFVANGTIFKYLLSPTAYFAFLICFLPFFTGLIEVYSLLEHEDPAYSILRFCSILLLWLGFISLLCLFQSIGVMLIGEKHSETLILFACAHAAIVYFSFTPPTNGGESTFKGFDQSLKNFWSGLLASYDFFEPWENNHFVDIMKIVYSFFANIVIMNILIALVNNVYQDVHELSYARWTMMRAHIISYMELLMLLPSERQNEEYFPYTITYEAFTKEVEDWNTKLEAKKDQTWDVPLSKKIQDCLDKLENQLSKP
ncbi:11179_t:CDS:2 [Funneliformis mosseae]|uniref:11179_t:CDS:1 n=1 Tax=Funneliformis mosseae TaxID=27381 RepID=A0A9N8YZJ7_FUNMO|nr:11179_t:CDS:2 [Funneliformis mosseae]